MKFDWLTNCTSAIAYNYIGVNDTEAAGNVGAQSETCVANEVTM